MRMQLSTTLQAIPMEFCASIRNLISCATGKKTTFTENCSFKKTPGGAGKTMYR
jgi:hypothetical protein